MDNNVSDLLHPGAGTMRLEIISSLIILSLGGGGHTRLSMISSVVDLRLLLSSGGSRWSLKFYFKNELSYAEVCN